MVSSTSLSSRKTTSALRSPTIHRTPKNSTHVSASIRRTHANSPIEIPLSSSSSQESHLSEEDQILVRWEHFFRMTQEVSDDLKRVYAIAKLTQLALVQYMALRRGIYPPAVFKKSRYGAFPFFILNRANPIGKRLNDILTKAGNCITYSAIKSLRFQVFHDPKNPKHIGEEVHFMFHYGKGVRAELDFGNGNTIELDMKDCSFKGFLKCFGSIIGTIRGCCANLSPLPPTAEKRIRASFCKRLPANFNTGPFHEVTGKFDYAPDIITEQLGTALLPEIGVGAILRTRYLLEDPQYESKREKLVQEIVEKIFTKADGATQLNVSLQEDTQVPVGAGGAQVNVGQTSPDQPEVARQPPEESVPPPASPDQTEVARQEIVAHQLTPRSEVPSSMTANSPYASSIASCEVTLPPFASLPHDTTVIPSTTSNANETANVSNQHEEEMQDEVFDSVVAARANAPGRIVTREGELARAKAAAKRRRLDDS